MSNKFLLLCVLIDITLNFWKTNLATERSIKVREYEGTYVCICKQVHPSISILFKGGHFHVHVA